MKRDAMQVSSNQGGAIRIRALVWALVILMVLVGVAIGYNQYLSRHEYRKAPNQFVNAILNNDAETAYGLMGPDLKKMFFKDTWKESVKSSSAFLNKAKPKVIKDEAEKEYSGHTYGKNGQPRRLTYQFTSGNKSVAKMFVIVFKDGETWKIGDFNTAQ